MKKPEKSQGRQQKNNIKDGLTVEERINSALLYTPEIFTWTKESDSKD